MRHPTFNYVDTAYGDVSRRNHVTTLELAIAHGTGRSEAYTTLYRFEQDYLEYCEHKKSVAGYSGPCYSDYVVFDIDRDDLEIARRDTLALWLTLQDEYEVGTSQIRCFFSGRKGYHLYLPMQLFGSADEFPPSVTFPKMCAKIAKGLAQDAGVTIDPVIYEKNRLFRLPNSQHKLSHLFKIPLDWNDLARPSSFHRELAKTQRDLPFTPYDLEANPHLHYLRGPDEEEEKPPKASGPNGATWSANPVDFVNVISSAYKSGQRHDLALVFSGWAAKNGLSRASVLAIFEILGPTKDVTDAVNGSFNRFERGEGVKGYSDLTRFFDDVQIEHLEMLRQHSTNGDRKPEEPTVTISYDWGEDGADWNVPDLVPLIDGLIAKGNFVYLAGETQASKTLFSLFLVGHLLYEQALFGKYAVSGPNKILYLVLEDPPRRIKNRINDIKRHFSSSRKTGSATFQFAPLNLVKRDQFQTFTELVQPYDVIWLDTYQRATPGIASFNDEEQSTILHGLATLTRQHGKTVVIVDHVRKSADSKSAGPKRAELSIEDLKGTGSKAQNADTVLLLQRQHDGKLLLQSQSKDFENLHLHLTLSKPGSTAPKYEIFEAKEAGERSTATGQNNRELVFSFLPPDGSTISIAEIEIGLQDRMKLRTIQDHLKVLCEAERAICIGFARKARYKRTGESRGQITHDTD